jgi:hypothetical protein
MPYYEVKDFAAGMDLRKSPITAPAGTLRLLKNAHVTAGGEIEKRTEFLKWAQAPAGSVGLITYGDQVYAIVGSGAATGGVAIAGSSTAVGAISIPTSGAAVTYLLDWDLYDGRPYMHIGFAGTSAHFYMKPDLTVVPTPGLGSYVKTYKSKMHGVAGKTLYWSAVNDPMVWAAGTAGAGSMELAQSDSDMSNCLGLEVYYDYMAILSNEATQLWFLDPDPNKNQFRQVLRQSGTPAAKSVRQYGSGDVLFLGYDGIRSLKAREQSVSASVSDIGSPLDPMITQMFAAGTPAMSTAIAALQPYSGRYWMCFSDRILVLSNFPQPKISAWSVYYPEFVITDVAETTAGVFLRGADNWVYRYGGPTPVYDSCPVEVELPFLSFEKPATFKTWKAIDAIATGDWDVYMSQNTEDLTAEDYLGKITKPTFLGGQFPLMGHSTHCSLRFRSAAPGAQTLASLMIHYDLTETT